MIAIQSISYDKFLKEKVSADIVINASDTKRNYDDQNAYYQIQCSSKSFLAVQYNIGIPPLIKEIKQSHYFALALNTHIYIIDYAIGQIVFTYVSNTACEMFQIYANDLLFICEAEIVVFYMIDKKVMQTIYLPDMIEYIEDCNPESTVISLYNNTRYVIHKSNNQYQIKEIKHNI